MKKQLLVSALAVMVIASTAPSASAQNWFTKFFKNVGNSVSSDTKSILNDFKSSVKTDLTNSETAAKKSKIEALKTKKDAQLQPLDDKITAKKKEIAAVKKADMLETERTARLTVLNRQLKDLETRRNTLENA